MSKKDEKVAEELGVDLDEGETKPRLAPVDDYPDRPYEEAQMSQKEAEKTGGGAVPRKYQNDDPENVVAPDSLQAEARARETGSNRQHKPGASGPGVRKEG